MPSGAVPTPHEIDAAPVGIDRANQLGKVTSIPGTLIAGPISAAGATFQSIGDDGGASLTTGDFYIAIGNGGTAGEPKTIRIGSAAVAPYNAAYIQGIFGAAIPRRRALPF